MANLLSTIVSGRLAIGSETTTPYLTEALDGIVFGGNEAGYYYRLYTQKENYGGDYTKLNLSWHTGIKIGAWRGYGGIRFYDNSPHTGAEVFSVAKGDGNVRVSNTLHIGDTSTGLYLEGSRLRVRSTSVDNVAQFATYGMYLPQTGQTAGLYVESPIEARGGLRIGSDASSGTITVGAATSVVANRIVQRDANGYIYANHINFSTPESENPAISSFITSNGDGWSRKSSLAHVRNQLGNYGNWITTDGRAYPRRSDGTGINFYWDGQGGQPTWLWGSNNGVDFYVWNPSNFSVNYASSAGNADTVDGYHSNTVGNRHHTARGFYVDGDQNTYYPVLIQGSGNYAFNRYSIYRYYGWTAPWDPIGTGAHRGGLTFDVEWSGDIAWGGNDHTLRVVQFSETYTTMVAGMTLPVTGGLCVWLRGGHAYYEIQVDAYPTTPTVYYDVFTAGNGAEFRPRTDTSNVQSEIYNRMPVRGSSELYDGGSRVITAGNIGSQSVSYATTSGSTSGNSATTSQRDFSGDISTSGQGRFAGWYSGNAQTGVAAEIGMSGGQGYIFVYNRQASTYGTLNIAASGANLQFSGSTINATSGTLQQGGNNVIHAGNIGSQSVSYAASAGVVGTADYAVTAGNADTVGGYAPTIAYSSNNVRGKVLVADPGSGNISTQNPELYSGEVRLGAAWDRGGVYASGVLSLSTSSSQIDFVFSNSTRAFFASDGNLWMSWAGAYISTLLDAKQNTSTAINTGNIASQTVGQVNQTAHNRPAILLNASGTTDAGGSLGMQQVTGEGWTGIFVDYEPYTGWGLWHDNPNNYFSFTAEASTGSIRSFTVPSRESGNRTAHEKFRIDQASGDVIVGRDGYAQSSFRAPIFYDSNDTNYYLDPNGSSVLNGTVVIKGNDNQLAIDGTTGALASGLFFRESGVNKYELYHYSGEFRFYNYTTGQQEMSINNAGGFVTARTSFRAPIFYDSNDTGYYLDPNGTSNLIQLTTDTRARWGMPRWWNDRSSFTSDQNYWTGTNGWGTSAGNWDNAWRGGFSGWDIWGEGSAHPQGGQYVHAQGIVSGQHYALSDGSSAYGWMMVGAHAATENRYWLRGKWGGSTSGWTEMMTSNNNPYAWNMNQYVRTTDGPTFAEVYSNGWFRNYGNQGIYNQTYGTHFYSNGSGSWGITGSGGAVELQFRSNHQSTLRGYVYADTSNQIGFLNNGGGWNFRTNSDKNAFIHGQTLTINADNAGWSSIYMNDGDEGMRELHCNSNRIGFLTQAGSWGAWLYDSADWEAGGSVRAPIFYDSNDTAFYVDPNSSSRVRNLYVGDSGSNWSDPGGWGTQFHVSNGPHSIIRVYARNEGIETIMYSHVGGQSKVGSGTNHDFSIVRNFTDRMTFYSGYTYANGYLQAAESLRAPIFYDSNDTTFFLDPNADLSLRVYGEICNSNYAEGKMQPGALNIGRIDTNYAWDGGSWASDVRLGLLANTSETWEFGIHDSGDSVMSVVHFDGGSTLTMGRNLGWGQCIVNAPAGYVSNSNPWGTANSAYFPNGITTAGGTNWIYGFTYIGNAPSNGAGHEFTTSGTQYSTGSITTPLFLVNNHSDNTKGYRIHNTSGSSVSAMFVNSSNQLVIAAGAVDQVNLNKKVLVNGVALGVNVAPSGTAGRIDASNDIVAYSSSDERLKHNITPIENALNKVKSLTGVEFDWKPEYKNAHGYEGHDTGIIAQQVEAVMPSAVRTNDTGFLAVRYEKLIGLLIEGMKEQQAQIDELKAKLDGLTK